MQNSSKYEDMDAKTLDNLREGFQIIGYDWKYLFVNDAVVKHSQYSSKKDLLGLEDFLRILTT